jgi:hypothetical protein
MGDTEHVDHMSYYSPTNESRLKKLGVNVRHEDFMIEMLGFCPQLTWLVA